MHRIAFIIAFGISAAAPVFASEILSWKEPVLASAKDPILKAKSSPMPDRHFSSVELTKLTETLAQEMFSHWGILGIAAPQMSVGLRIFLSRSSINNPFNRSYEVFINPSITPVGDSTSSRIEFCLSIKGFYWIKRYDSVQLKFYKVDGTQETITLTGSKARIAQHEIDHLDGKLISDRD